MEAQQRHGYGDQWFGRVLGAHEHTLGALGDNDHHWPLLNLLGVDIGGNDSDMAVP